MTWTKSAIRNARKADLVKILTNRRYRLCPLKNGNFLVTAKPPGEDGRILAPLSSAEGPDTDDPARPHGIIVKLNYWVWHEKNIAGNTIDFFVEVERKTFNQAMKIITSAKEYDPAGQYLRKEREIVPESLR